MLLKIVIMIVVAECSWPAVLSLVKNKNIPKWKKQACDVPPSQYSHYKCDEFGDLKCLPGWQGDLCDVPICRKNCDPLQGYCKRPNECRCKLGFYGENCERCIPLPGCQHGSCRTPFECACFKGYEGIFCQEPICKEDCHPTHGYCDRAGECKCRLGWTGPTCRDCQVLPGCLHGFCSKPLECRCLPGWTGIFCETAICDPNCNKRNGYCTKPGECRCKVGWMGKNCTECHPYPGCQHGDCQRPWECNCKQGFGGMLCDEELNHCEKNADTCMHGGKCTSLTKEDGSYKCECPSGFKGDRCDRLTNAPTTTTTTMLPSVPNTMTMTMVNNVSFEDNDRLSVVTPTSIMAIPINSYNEPILKERSTSTQKYAKPTDENENET